MAATVAGDIYLPPGFRFHPTDDELINHYLCRKSAGGPISVPIISEIDLYKYNPWELPDLALYGEEEWYFFSPRDRKYPNGSRPNRAAESGYWKATGADRPIWSPKPLAIKKALVFYASKAPKVEKTNWIMHEYRLADVDRSARMKGTGLPLSFNRCSRNIALFNGFNFAINLTLLAIIFFDRMGNIFESLASGLGKAIGSIFHAPVDFLSGKACSSICGPTWDLACYIENFCLANVLKLGLVLVVVYIVFLFTYLTYKLRVFHCLFFCVFKTIWTCCSTCLCTCCHCCSCLFDELSAIERRPRRAHMDYHDSLNSFRFGNNNMSLQGRDRARRRYGRRHNVRRSLRPMSHRVRVGFRRKNEYGGGYNRFIKRRRGSAGDDVAHGVRVTRTTKFANKG